MLPQHKGNDGLRRLMAEAAYQPIAALAVTYSIDADVARIQRRDERKRVKAYQRLLSDAYGGKKRRNRRPRARAG